MVTLRNHVKKTVQEFSPAEFGMHAPNQQLTFSAQKSIADYKHTPKNTAINPENKESTWFVHCWEYTN